VQIDVDARLIGSRYPTEVNLCGDAAETLRALIPLLERKADRRWQEQIEESVERWWQILEARANQSARPLNPLKVFHELSPRLPDGCIVTADSGSGTNWWARHLRFKRGMRGALSGGLATMGPALPYAIAAKFVHPDRPVIAIEGDGAMQMNGINALIDVAKYHERWTDPRFVVLVLNNRDLNQVTWEQRVLVGDPKLEASQRIPDFPFARYAELLGFTGLRVDAPDQVADAWDTALSASGPVVLEAVTDPEVPPLPPHIEFEQARNLAKALAKGDPARGQIVRQSLKGKLAEIVTR
jgi:pyruvate dehydrogenase (quinone)